MSPPKNVMVINGSASANSSNERLIENVVRLAGDTFSFAIFNDLKSLPHFDPQLSSEDPPAAIVDLRDKIAKADGVIICTPEYIFSIPSGLKNAIEWCVSTVVFTDKPLGIITASASGQKCHEELMMIMRTVGARFTEDTTLLIQGVKGKISIDGEITDLTTQESLKNFLSNFRELVLD